METLLKGKPIAIYFDDKSTSGITRKDGIGIELTASAIAFKDTTGLVQVIPLCRVVRIIEKPQEG